MSELRSIACTLPLNAGLLSYLDREWSVSRSGDLYLVVSYSRGHVASSKEEREKRALEITSRIEAMNLSSIASMKDELLRLLAAERTGAFPSLFMQASLVHRSSTGVDYWTSGGHVVLHCRAAGSTVTLSADARSGTVMPRKTPAPLAETNLMDRFDTIATIDTEQWFRSGRVELQANEALLITSMGAEPEAIWSGPVSTKQLWSLESGWKHGMRADVFAIGVQPEVTLPSGCSSRVV